MFMEGKKRAAHQIIGEVGEKTACRFLVKHGFSVIGRNYRRKWGEIDIIAEKGKVLHFVEVKTVSRENIREISRETSFYRPEENVHPKKLERLFRVIQTYLIDMKADDREWQLDVVAVYLDMKHREAKVSLMENVIV